MKQKIMNEIKNIPMKLTNKQTDNDSIYSVVIFKILNTAIKSSGQ